MNIFRRFNYITAITIVILVSFFSFAAEEVSACNNAPSLSMETKRSGPNVFYEHRSPIVVNDSLNNIGQDVSLTAQGSGCSGTVYYYFNAAYWNGSDWVTYDSSANIDGNNNGWITANHIDFPLDEGIRGYSFGVETYTDTNGRSPLMTYKHLFAMTKTSSSANVTSTSVQLSWSLRMNYYVGVSCNSDCSQTVKFYMLMGTDPAILGDRTVAAGEFGPISPFSQDYDSSTIRMTWAINNHFFGSLSPNTTYYWRIRGDHPGIPDSYFAGGSFTTTPILPPSPSPSPSSSPSPSPSGSCGLSNIQILDALVTSPLIDGQTSVSTDTTSTTKCIIDPKAAFVPFKIPTFEDLKSLYYDQKKP